MGSCENKELGKLSTTGEQSLEIFCSVVIATILNPKLETPLPTFSTMKALLQRLKKGGKAIVANPGLLCLSYLNTRP